MIMIYLYYWMAKRLLEMQNTISRLLNYKNKTKVTFHTINHGVALLSSYGRAMVEQICKWML